MRTSSQDSIKVVEELAIIARLQIFDDTELTHSLEYDGMSHIEALQKVFSESACLIRDAGIQLEQENFIYLEFVVHKLRTLFLSIGCQRLSFLLERMYRNLTKVRIDYLRTILGIAKEEFKLAKQEVSSCLKVPRQQLESA